MNFTIIPASYSPILLSVLRIATGLAFVEHGTGKILNFPPIQEAMGKVLGSGMLYFTGTIELVGGLLITLGLLTRPVAFVLSGFMAVAYWMVHVGMGGLFPAINQGEAALLYCFVFLYLAAAGPGPISVDQLSAKAAVDGRPVRA